MNTRQTKKCTNCYRDVPEADHHEARMTKDGMTCAPCYASLATKRRIRGGIPELPKHLRVPDGPGLGTVVGREYW